MAKAKKNWEREASSKVEVTEVRINWTSDKKKDKVKALCSITLNNCIDIAVRLVEGKGGLFVSLPSYKNGDSYYSSVFIADPVVMETINQKVIAAYEEENDWIVVPDSDIKDLPFD